MKKFFTLIAAALMAVSANAAASSEAIADKNIDLTGVTTEWTAAWQWATIKSYTSGEFTIDATAHTASDENVTYGDASAYDYLILEYSAATCEVGVYVQYQTNGTQTGTNTYANFYQDEASATKSETGGFAAVKLGEAENSDKSKISSVSIMNKAAGSITITAMYWATAEEYEALKAADDAKEKESVLFEGNETIELAAGGWGWVQGGKGGAGWLDLDASKYNSLVFEIASATGKCKATAEDDSSDKISAEAEIAASTEPAVYVADISSFTKLSQYAWQNLNKPDTEEATEADIAATTLVVTKVYVTSKLASEFTGISSISADDADVVKSEYFNVAGQKVDGASKGLTIVKQTLSNGKTVSKKVVLK